MLDKFFILLHADDRLLYIWIVSNMHMQHLHLWLENHSKISPGTLLGGLCLCLRYYTTLIC